MTPLVCTQLFVYVGALLSFTLTSDHRLHWVVASFVATTLVGFNEININTTLLSPTEKLYGIYNFNKEMMLLRIAGAFNDAFNKL